MNKTKEQRGITLIALIITVIILLILAVVTIGSMKDGKIITYAQNAASGYEKSKDNEIGVLGEYEQLIEKNNPNVIKIDYDAIARILTKYHCSNELTPEEAFEQLKLEAKINDENIEYLTDLIVPEKFNNNIYFYFYQIDALYLRDSNAKTYSYVSEEGYEEQYAFGRNVKAIKEELESIFIGKTVSEISEKYNEGTLDEYVLENSNNLIEISFDSLEAEYLKVSSVTLKNGENETTISEEGNNYSILIICLEESYYNIVEIDLT